MGSFIRSASALLAAVLMVSAASAYDFYAGGRDGWVQKPSEAYNQWAARMRFQVHDKIVFTYKKGEDSVLLVEEEDYKSCNVKKPIKEMSSGSSVFHLDRSGPFFFVSGHPGNCANGQKLVVVVMSQRNNKNANTPPIPPPIASPSPSPLAKPPTASPSPSPLSNSPSPTPFPSPYAPSPSPSVSDAPSPSPWSSDAVSPSPSKAESPSSTAYVPTLAPAGSPDSSAAFVTASFSVVSFVMLLLGSTAIMV